MQAHLFSRYFLFSKNCIFYPKKIIYPLLLPSHNCIIFSMFSFQGAFLNFLRNSMKSHLSMGFQSISHSFCILHSALCILRSGGPRTRFSAEKPRRLQQSTGLLPRAAFRVHFGFLAFGTRSSRSWLLFQSFKKWWAKMDSNHRPHDYQSCALASWAIGPYQLHFFFGLVEISGIEPLTSCLQGRRSPSWAKPPNRQNQIHNLHILCEHKIFDCVFVSPLPNKPASLGFAGVPSYHLRYIFSIPCKLNNAQILRTSFWP